MIRCVYAVWKEFKIEVKALSPKRNFGALGGFGNFDAGLEGVAEVGHVGDGEDAGKVGGDGVDGCNQPIAAFLVLGAEAFIYDEHLQCGARSLGEEPCEGETNGKVDAKGFTAGIGFVRTGAVSIGDDDVEGFGKFWDGFILSGAALGDELGLELVVGESG